MLSPIPPGLFLGSVNIQFQFLTLFYCFHTRMATSTVASSSSDEPRKRAKPSDGDDDDNKPTDTGVPQVPAVATLAMNYEVWRRFEQDLHAQLKRAKLEFLIVVEPYREREYMPALKTETPEQRVQRARNPAAWIWRDVEEHKIFAVLPPRCCPGKTHVTTCDGLVRLVGTSLFACNDFYEAVEKRFKRGDKHDAAAMDWIRQGEVAPRHVWPPPRK